MLRTLRLGVRAMILAMIVTRRGCGLCRDGLHCCGLHRFHRRDLAMRLKKWPGQETARLC